MRLPKQPYSKQDQNNDREFVITVFHPVLNRQQHREEKLFSFELEIKREENNKKTQDPYKTNILILWGVHGYTQLCLKQANKKKPTPQQIQFSTSKSPIYFISALQKDLENVIVSHFIIKLRQFSLSIMNL